MIGAPLPITVREMRALPEYSWTLPTDPKPGTVWRRHVRRFDPVAPSGFAVARTLPPEDDSGSLPIEWREALLIPNGATVEVTVGGFVGRLASAPGREVFAADVRDVCRALWGLRA